MKNRNGFSIMLGLIVMVKPLLGHMLLAIIMGCIGNLMASFITILGGYGILSAIGLLNDINLRALFAITIILAVLRGVFRYAEQSLNHYIAFKLLAVIRHKVFKALRALAPAKLDTRERGNLISLITSDIELLEVFYAHTISPVAIAIITSLIMVIFISLHMPQLAIIALCGYILVGAVIPYFNSKRGLSTGREYRKEFGRLNTAVLDNLYGLNEISQFEQQKKRINQMNENSLLLENKNHLLKKYENTQKIMTDSTIILTAAVGVIVSANMVINHNAQFSDAIISVIAIMSSFGPVAALSALSNNLNQTLASAGRVLDLIEEVPVVEEIKDKSDFENGDIKLDNVSFSYKDERDKNILDNFQYKFEKGRIYGIHGKSGCGKSTLLKLLMRFYETDNGNIFYDKNNINDINTRSLRKNIAFVTQETFLFNDTIENNIKIANEKATRKDVIMAAKKASIHEFISTLPNGYDTHVSELSNVLSGGEKQRIGVARAFLHNSDIIYLDEPTSNIDSLNEGIIIKSLDKEKENKTIIMVSHRKSTMGIANEIISM